MDQNSWKDIGRTLKAQQRRPRCETVNCENQCRGRRLAAQGLVQLAITCDGISRSGTNQSEDETRRARCYDCKWYSKCRPDETTTDCPVRTPGCTLLCCSDGEEPTDDLANHSGEATRRPVAQTSK